MDIRRKQKKSEHKGKSKEILVDSGPIEKRMAVLEGGKLVDFFMERKGLEHYAGSIYKGKVCAILPGIDAAFIDIGMEKNGFLHVSDVVDKGSVLKEMLPDVDEGSFQGKKQAFHPKIKDTLKMNQEIMVQVVKEAISTKGPRLTSYISIPGRYLVLTPFDKNIGVSRRITDRNERKRIRGILDKFKEVKDVGCIVRTVAEKRSEEELRNEFRYLLNLWAKVKSRADRSPAPVAVYEEYGVVLRVIRDAFGKDVSSLIVDSKEEHARIIKFLKAYMPSLRQKVKLYKGRTPLFEKYKLDKVIDGIFERKVPLKSGGYLVIEQTEGVVVIDVNTGSFVGRRGLEETAYKTDLEAAEEIPKQLLLRDVGGIIIIDFIDMEVKAHRDKVSQVLQDNLKADKARISVRGMSQFGIVEMTRQRMRKSLESASRVECPYCGGKGMVKSIETIAIEAVRRIDKLFSDTKRRRRQVTVTLHPDIHELLVSNQARMLSDIQRKCRSRMELREDKGLHIEDVIIDED